MVAVVSLYILLGNSSLNLRFEKKEDGSYKVVSRIFYCPILLLPSHHFFNEVTEIGNGAFEWNGLKMIIIPNTVTEIGDGAFSNNKGLKRVYLGKSVERIGIDAFSYCSKLEYVRMSPNIKTIDHMAFEYCENLNKIDFPEGLKKIGNCAFLGCRSLSTVVFPKTLDTVGKMAFAKTRLNDITFLNSNTKYYEDTFECNSYVENNAGYISIES